MHTLPTGSMCIKHNSYYEKMQDKSKSMTLAKALGDTIRQYRKFELNKSTTQLADEYELRSGTLCKVENASVITKLETVWMIAEAMELKPSELIKMVEDYLGSDFKFMDE